MADVKWIKIVTDLFDDEKIKWIETQPKGDTVLVVWFKLLCLAGKSNSNGDLMLTDRIAYDEDMIVAVLRKSKEAVKNALKVLESLDMIEVGEHGEIHVSKWEKHQSVDKLNDIREKTKLRVRKYRQKPVTSNASETPTVTQCNTDGNVTVTHIELELELDKELKIKPLFISHEQEGWFTRFWNRYPKKQGRKEAEKSFMKNITTAKMFDEVMDDIEKRIGTYDWYKQGGQYIPMPATYLNQERWKDEVKNYGSAPATKVNGREAPMPAYPATVQELGEEEAEELKQWIKDNVQK